MKSNHKVFESLHGPVTYYFIQNVSVCTLKDRASRLIKEGCRRDISIERRLEIRKELTLLRRQMRAKRSRLDLIYGK